MLRSAARFPWPLLLVQGVMNSAMLGGYLAGQIPAGFLSDMLGGERLVPFPQKPVWHSFASLALLNYVNPRCLAVVGMPHGMDS